MTTILQERNANMTRIIPCSCSNAYQDKRYGAGNRVMNESGKKVTGSIEVICTVCGTKKHITKQE
jgi:hypothetical protein